MRGRVMGSLLAVGLVVAACDRGSTSRPAEPPRDAAGAGAGAGAMVHGFPVYPKLTQVCTQHVSSAPGPNGGEIDWALYAGDEAPAAVAAWYRAKLGEQLVTDANGWAAHLPTDAAPEQVLEIGAPDRPGPRCGEVPASARTVVRLSTLTRR
jgi:hypothetical protein